MALYDISSLTDSVTVSDALPTERIVVDATDVTDAIQAIIVDTLSITNARALSETKVRIDFSAPAAALAGNPALTDPSSYTFTPVSPGAVGVIPQSVSTPPGQSEPLYVEVLITEHTDGAIYQVALSPLIRGANSEVGGGAAALYAGKGASPVVERVFPTSATEVIVLFDEQVLDNPAANDVSNYIWDHGISTVSVKSVIGNMVTLETTTQNEGELYNLTVRGLFQVAINDAIQTFDSQPIPDLVSIWIADQVIAIDQVHSQNEYAREANDLIAAVDHFDEAVQRFAADVVQATDQVSLEVAYDQSISDTISTPDSLQALFEPGTLSLPSSFASARTAPGQPEFQISSDGTNWNSTNLVPYPNEVPRNGNRNPETGTIIYVGDNGMVVRSGDEGYSWANINAAAALGIPLTFDMSAVWFGGGRWIIAGSLPSTGGQVYYSDDDGLSWSGPIDPDGGTGTGPTGGATAGFSDIFYDGIYVDALGLHCAVGFKGAIWTSPDGAIWTERTAANNYIGSFYGFRGIDWSLTQGLAVIVGDADEVQTSPDLINWTKQAFATSPAVTTPWGVFYSATHDLWVMHGNGAGGLSNLQTSPDGVNWTNRSISAPNNHALYSGGYDYVNDLFIVAGRFGRVHNSLDGLAWSYTPADDTVSPFLEDSSSSIFALVAGGTPPVPPPPIEVTSGDTISVSDSASVEMTYGVTNADSVITTEQIDVFIGTFYVESSDSASVSDQVVRSVSFDTSASDSVVVSDTLVIGGIGPNDVVADGLAVTANGSQVTAT